MGVSTDGILVFGFEIGEEGDEPDFLAEHNGDFEEFLHSVSGLPRWGEPGHSFAAFREFEKGFPIELVSHCSYEYPMYILAVNGTKKKASRGYPEVISPEELIISDEKIEAFKKFCDDYGIEWQEPKWLLCSMWG